jgi:hypothetical protein
LANIVNVDIILDKMILLREVIIKDWNNLGRRMIYAV